MLQKFLICFIETDDDLTFSLEEFDQMFLWLVECETQTWPTYFDHSLLVEDFTFIFYPWCAFKSAGIRKQLCMQCSFLFGSDCQNKWMYFCIVSSLGLLLVSGPLKQTLQQQHETLTRKKRFELKVVCVKLSEHVNFRIL